VASILVVEDDPLFREAVVNFLCHMGHSVEAASCADEALALAKAGSFDLLLNDIRIAGQLDGVEALSLVRKVHPEIRCILMTGFADAEAPIRAARLQADDYLLKPFKLQTLKRSLESVLEKDFQTPDCLSLSPGPDLRWLFDERLQLLEAHRELALHQFFLLARSQRLSSRQAYSLFCDWEKLELDYMNNQNPGHWDRLTSEYREWTRQLGTPDPPSRSSETLPFSNFELLFARMQSGVIQSRQLQQAIRLLHKPELRRESLQNYCTYHWLWSDQLDEGDPFLGLTLEGYRLVRHRSVPSPWVRLYEVEAEQRPQYGDLVLCVPDNPEWQPLLDSDLRSERATALTHQFGHHFLLYKGYSFSLQARLPSQGVPYAQAWKVMRPVFLQVAAFHQQNRFSGSFSLRDIDSPPGQPCSLSRFSEAAYRETHRMLNDSQPMQDYFSAPEVPFQAQPDARSDLAVLGRLLFEVVHGGRYPDPNLWLHLRSLGQPEANLALSPHLSRLGPLAGPFYRLAHEDPKERFSRVEEAIAALDAAVRSPS